MLTLLLCAFLAAAKPVHPFLYRVTVGDHVSYLLGTVPTHLLTVSDFDDSLRRALTEVGAVYYENDDPVNSEREMKMISELPARRSPWSETLPPVALARLRALLHSVGRSKIFPAFDTLPAGGAFVMTDTLSQMSELARGVMPYPFAILTQLVSREAKLRMVPLNNVDDNFALLNAVMTDAAYAEFLETHLDDMGRYVFPPWQREHMTRETQRYLRGEVPERQTPTSTPLTQAHRAFREAQSMNHLQWYPILLAALRRESVLINVDVARLTDAGAILERLSRESDVRVVRLMTCGGAL